MSLQGQLKDLIAKGLTFADCVCAFGDDDSNPYVAAAREKSREGEIEVDDFAVISESASEGCYVMAWMWIYDSEAGVSS